MPILVNTQMNSHASVCLLDENGEQLSNQTLMENLEPDRPFVQLIDSNGEVLLPKNIYRLPLSVALHGEPCFNQPFYLLNDGGDYQWLSTDGEVLYDVYWFDNGPDYASDGLFRFKQNGLIGYADAKTFAVVIPAQFEVAHPFVDGKAKVAYHAAIQKSDGEHMVWLDADYITIDQQGNKLNE